MEIYFRRMEKSDLSQMHIWLNTNFVAQYWKNPASPEDVKRKYEPYITGENPTTPYIIIIDGVDVGYIQTYYYSDYKGAYYDLFDVGTFTAGIDLFIGHIDYIHKGYGVHVIKNFIEKHIFSNSKTTNVMITPEPDNAIAIKVYEKIGFKWYKTITTPDGERIFDVFIKRRFFKLLRNLSIFYSIGQNTFTTQLLTFRFFSARRLLLLSLLLFAQARDVHIPPQANRSLRPALLLSLYLIKDPSQNPWKKCNFVVF